MRYGPARIANFVAHDGPEFQSDHRQTQDAERRQRQGAKTARREIFPVHQPAVLENHDGAHDDQRAADGQRPDAAHIVHPLAYAEPANIGEHSDP